jgi:hypothetical protein
MKKKRRSWKEKEFINQSKYNPEDESEEKNGRERESNNISMFVTPEIKSQ